MGEPAKSLGEPETSLGAPRITVEQSGNTTSSLGMLLVHLEIIATTYCSMIFKTHEFSLYSHLCIYVSIWLPIYTRYISTGCRRCRRAIRDTSENEDRVNSEIHSEAVIE